METHLINAEPYGNSDAYRPKVLNRHFPKVGSAIFLRAPQLYGVFPKDGFYHTQRTQLINAEAYKNPDAYRLEVTCPNFRKVGAAIS